MLDSWSSKIEVTQAPGNYNCFTNSFQESQCKLFIDSSFTPGFVTPRSLKD